MPNDTLHTLAEMVKTHGYSAILYRLSELANDDATVAEAFEDKMAEANVFLSNELFTLAERWEIEELANDNKVEGR